MSDFINGLVLGAIISFIITYGVALYFYKKQKEEYDKLSKKFDRETRKIRKDINGLYSDNDIDICDDCGSEIDSDAEFCPYCGVEFEN